MWYRTTLAQLILPENFGSSILKPKYKRGLHSVIQFDEDRIPSIREHGLRIDKSRGHTYGEPDLIWGTIGEPYNKDVPNVEIQISPENIQSAEIPWHLRDEEEIDKYWEIPKNYFALRKDIPPEDIIAIHEPWQDQVRYILENPDTLDYVQERIDEFLNPKNSWYDKKIATAVQYLIEQGILKR